MGALEHVLTLLDRTGVAVLLDIHLEVEDVLVSIGCFLEPKRCKPSIGNTSI